MLDAAREVFVAHGFSDASIADIVERAGSSVGSLYHHFGGKSELYVALWQEYSLAQEEAAPPEVVELATRRQGARASGDFAEADRLRGEIAGLGWTVRDVAEGFQLVRTTRAA